MYSYVPGTSNRTVADWSLLRAPVSHAPPGSVAVCGASSRFVQVTVDPARTSTGSGAYTYSTIATDRGPAGVGAGTGRGGGGSGATVETGTVVDGGTAEGTVAAVGGGDRATSVGGVAVDSATPVVDDRGATALVVGAEAEGRLVVGDDCSASSPEHPTTATTATIASPRAMTARCPRTAIERIAG